MSKMVKQKILAVLIFILAIISIFAFGEMDGTVALFLIPLSIGLFISKECWLAE